MAEHVATAVDLFAGLGGFTEGARQAGVKVLWAANHWQAAVQYHSLNHSDVIHACQDLHQANWLHVPAHDILLASPSCQGHSRARGTDKPHHDSARSTAWAVVSCAEVHRPLFCVVENVPEMLTWELYPTWEMAMRALGYSVSPHILDAADYGVPQNRKRAIIICTRSRAPFLLRHRLGPHRPIEPYIDWDAPRWRTIDRKLARKTHARIAHGRKHHGERFLICYYGNTLTSRALSRPVGTLTTKDRWAVIDGDRMRMFNVQECRRAMGFPDSYQLPENSALAKHMLGNAVPPPMVREVLREILEAA